MGQWKSYFLPWEDEGGGAFGGDNQGLFEKLSLRRLYDNEVETTGYRNCS